ncbi:MAG: hypothetical protein R3332_03540 [Pseudohongiellaceae bacterium]|nr:hypothetical protein [Pseudohongiellaceae bacterium]
MKAMWLEQKTLTQDQKNHITHYILPKLDSKAHDSLFACIESAWTKAPAYKSPNPLTPSELEKELRKTSKALERAISSINYLDRFSEGRLVDQHFTINTGLYIRPLLTNANPLDSSTKTVLEQIKKSCDDRAQEVLEARQATRQETRGKHHNIENWTVISDLAIYFTQHIPNSKPSYADNSPFLNLINYLFSEVMLLEVKDAKRQVRNCLSMMKTLEHPTNSQK